MSEVTRIKDISGVLYGSRLVTLPHVQPIVERVLAFQAEAGQMLVEVGFDHGYRLRDMAPRNPAWGFLGVEVR